MTSLPLATATPSLFSQTADRVLRTPELVSTILETFTDSDFFGIGRRYYFVRLATVNRVFAAECQRLLCRSPEIRLSPGWGNAHLRRVIAALDKCPGQVKALTLSYKDEACPKKRLLAELFEKCRPLRQLKVEGLDTQAVAGLREALLPTATQLVHLTITHASSFSGPAPSAFQVLPDCTGLRHLVLDSVCRTQPFPTTSPMPTYQLITLDISGANLSASAFEWLAGGSAATLRSLAIEAGRPHWMAEAVNRIEQVAPRLAEVDLGFIGGGWSQAGLDVLLGAAAQPSIERFAVELDSRLWPCASGEWDAVQRMAADALGRLDSQTRAKVDLKVIPGKVLEPAAASDDSDSDEAGDG